jgi:import inner membrane translocase subunit TIM50
MKRPGLSLFLKQMSQNYEVVLFADNEKNMAEEIAMALDPENATFSGILGRECTIVRNGRYVKDFSYLGRPIKDVIYIDFTTESAPFHTRNVVVLPEFDGDLDDRSLYDIIPFLKRKSNFYYGLQLYFS